MSTRQAVQDSISVFSKTFSYLQQSKMQSTNIEDLKKNWADDILNSIGVELKIIGAVSDNSSMLFLGNHISYLDIPVLMSAINKLSFVAKEELRMWPMFGTAAKKIDTVFVNRNNRGSRLTAKENIEAAIKNGKRIAIFPSGTTCMTESKIWRNGAFKIARNTNCFVQPFRMSYSKMRTAAYIDKDFFPLHLLKLCGSAGLTATLEFHEPIRILDAEVDCKKWQSWSRGLIPRDEFYELN